MTKTVALFTADDTADSLGVILGDVGADVVVNPDFAMALDTTGMVLCGSGEAAVVAATLRTMRCDRIVGRRLAGNRPVLAVGAVMGLLFDSWADSTGEVAGFAEWPGVSVALDAPHIGRSTVDIAADSQLFAGITADAEWFFDHTSAVTSWDLEVFAPFPAPQVSWARYRHISLVAAVENGPLTAMQFAPHLSGEPGSAVLRNWVRTL